MHAWCKMQSITDICLERHKEETETKRLGAYRHLPSPTDTQNLLQLLQKRLHYMPIRMRNLHIHVVLAQLLRCSQDHSSYLPPFHPLPSPVHNNCVYWG